MIYCRALSLCCSFLPVISNTGNSPFCTALLYCYHKIRLGPKKQLISVSTFQVRQIWQKLFLHKDSSHFWLQNPGSSWSKSSFLKLLSQLSGHLNRKHISPKCLLLPPHLFFSVLSFLGLAACWDEVKLHVSCNWPLQEASWSLHLCLPPPLACYKTAFSSCSVAKYCSSSRKEKKKNTQ